MPVNITQIVSRHGYGAGIGVAIAGVSYNIALALLASLLLFSGLIDIKNSIFGLFFASFLVFLIKYNVILFVFNLFPIPPLDGSRVLAFASLKLGAVGVAKALGKIEPYGLIILMLILFVPYLSSILFFPAKILLEFLLPYARI